MLSNNGSPIEYSYELHEEIINVLRLRLAIRYIHTDITLSNKNWEKLEEVWQGWIFGYFSGNKGVSLNLLFKVLYSRTIAELIPDKVLLTRSYVK